MPAAQNTRTFLTLDTYLLIAIEVINNSKSSLAPKASDLPIAYQNLQPLQPLRQYNIYFPLLFCVLFTYYLQLLLEKKRRRKLRKKKEKY